MWRSATRRKWLWRGAIWCVLLSSSRTTPVGCAPASAAAAPRESPHTTSEDTLVDVSEESPVPPGEGKHEGGPERGEHLSPAGPHPSPLPEGEGAFSRDLLPLRQQPVVLRRPIEEDSPSPQPVVSPATHERLIETRRDPPLGFTGPSGVRPQEAQETSDFVPIEDRWRLGFPAWDRYGKGHPWVDDYPYVEGHWWDPYNQNVLKGDYPILGQHTFLNLTATSQTLVEFRQVPTPTTPFESTVGARQAEFFGNPDQFFFQHNLKLSFELNHGDAAFKPADWRIKITPVFNNNYLDVEELAIVNPDVRHGTTRDRSDFALEIGRAHV